MDFSFPIGLLDKIIIRTMVFRQFFILDVVFEIRNLYVKTLY